MNTSDALQLVAQFFESEWAKTDVGDVHIRQVTGGLINTLHLLWRDSDAIKEPSAVLIRHFGLSGKIEEPRENSLTLSSPQQAVVYWELSRRGWGPKIYGLSLEADWRSTLIRIRLLRRSQPRSISSETLHAITQDSIHFTFRCEKMGSRPFLKSCRRALSPKVRKSWKACLPSTIPEPRNMLLYSKKQIGLRSSNGSQSYSINMAAKSQSPTATPTT